MPELPEVVRKEVEAITVRKPVLSEQTRDFGPMWLVPTYAGLESEGLQREWTGLVPPDSWYEWLGAFPVPGKPDALICIKCDDADHRLNNKALLNAARDLQPLEDEPISPTDEDIRRRLMVRSAFDPEVPRWTPSRLKPDQIKFEVTKETRELFTHLRNNFSSVWQRMNEALKESFERSRTKVDLPRVLTEHRLYRLNVDSELIVLRTGMPGHISDFTCGWDEQKRDCWLSLWHLDPTG